MNEVVVPKGCSLKLPVILAISKMLNVYMHLAHRHSRTLTEFILLLHRILEPTKQWSV